MSTRTAGWLYLWVQYDGVVVVSKSALVERACHLHVTVCPCQHLAVGHVLWFRGQSIEGKEHTRRNEKR